MEPPSWCLNFLETLNRYREA
jgi:hypothetical protein